MSRMVQSMLGGRATALPPTGRNKQYVDFPCVVPLLCGGGLGGGCCDNVHEARVEKASLY